jgi:hypothetical protein
MNELLSETKRTTAEMNEILAEMIEAEIFEIIEITAFANRIIAGMIEILAEVLETNR